MVEILTTIDRLPTINRAICVKPKGTILWHSDLGDHFPHHPGQLWFFNSDSHLFKCGGLRWSGAEKVSWHSLQSNKKPHIFFYTPQASFCGNRSILDSTLDSGESILPFQRVLLLEKLSVKSQGKEWRETELQGLLAFCCGAACWRKVNLWLREARSSSG